MVELPADIRQVLAQSHVRSEPSAEDQARVASALALRLGMPDADWTSPPPSAAKVPIAHTTWAVKLLAGAGAVGLATTLLVALPTSRKTGEGPRAAPLTAASTSRTEAPHAEVAPRASVDREPDASESRR
jgi:hypothetical protein